MFRENYIIKLSVAPNMYIHIYNRLLGYIIMLRSFAHATDPIHVNGLRFVDHSVYVWILPAPSPNASIPRALRARLGPKGPS